MTDYFALFALPRRPWIDAETLEEKYRELARQTHPDQSTDATKDFAEVNEAYRTLRDPKSRLQHLLAVEGKPPSASTAEIPTDLASLFMKIAPALKNNDKKEIDTLSQELSDRYGEAIGQLHRISEGWSENPSSNVIDAEALYRRFAFLSRWKNLVEEHRFQH